MSAPGADPDSGVGPALSAPAPRAPATSAPATKAPAAVAPALDELRRLLRPPNLPLPAPRSVLEASHRIDDLVAVGRLREARLLAESQAGEPSPLVHRLRLLNAHARALEAAGMPADAREVRREVVGLLDGAGAHEHARAVAALLPPPGAECDRAPVPGVSSRGRRRAIALESVTEDQVDDAVLAVVRGMCEPEPGPGTGRRELELVEGRLIGALEAHTAVAEQILGDPRPLLRLRFAQVLAALEQPERAAAQADHALALVAERAGDPEVEVADLDRIVLGACVVLAHVLLRSDPERAARCAADALSVLLDVDAAALRIRVITDLLRALMAAGHEREAETTASRLASLLGSSRRDDVKVRALLAIAEQRIRAGRGDAAVPFLRDVRRIGRRDFDQRALLSAARMLATVHGGAGRTPEALTELRHAAAAARWLADDLGASDGDRARDLRAELWARAAALHLAAESGDRPALEAESRALIDRTRSSGGRPVLDPGVLWEHAVDARIARYVAVGTAWAIGSSDASRELVELREEEARQEIESSPSGVARRRLFWRAALPDRTAMILAEAGRDEGALEAAHRAREAWARIGERRHVERVDAVIARLEGRPGGPVGAAPDRGGPDREGPDREEPDAENGASARRRA